MRKNIIVTLILCLCSSFVLFGQSLEEAKELYKIKEYARALPVFEQEYKDKPNDASVNQWYGVCLFETGKDLIKAEECISFASKKNIQDAYFYLGLIYTKTYRFDEAAKEFERYGKLKKRDKEASERLEEARAWLSLLKRSAQRPENIQIIDSIVVDKATFLDAYRLSPSSGNLSYYKTFFPDRGKSESVVYSNEKGDKIYYAKRPGEGKGYSLFSMEKLLDNFSNEKLLSDDNFNLSGDLNFPYVMADGVTIYFSAKDKNGFGGYDIYVTRYNMNNDTYLSPERLNMPFNSSFNDYMYVVDEEKGVGWFASDRFQPDGKVCVYTFIPNQSVDIIESEDDAMLIGRARISSIKASWKQGVNYSTEIALARKKVEAKIEKKKDFEFVINDSYTYYTLNDFKNPTAKDLYRQVIDMTNNLKELEATLDKSRDAYHKSSNATLSNDILRMESQQTQLLNNIADIEIKARNEEVKYLNR